MDSILEVGDRFIVMNDTWVIICLQIIIIVLSVGKVSIDVYGFYI